MKEENGLRRCRILTSRPSSWVGESEKTGGGGRIGGAWCMSADVSPECLWTIR